MLLHGIQIKYCCCMELLLQLHIKITLNQFETLRVLLLLITELTATDLKIGNLLGAMSQTTGIKRHHHGHGRTNHLIFEYDLGGVRNQADAAMNSIVDSFLKRAGNVRRKYVPKIIFPLVDLPRDTLGQYIFQIVFKLLQGNIYFTVESIGTNIEIDTW